MERYPWLNALYCSLVRRYTVGCGHHALLLHADEGHCEDILLFSLSCWLLCQTHKDRIRCGVCHSCRLMLSGNHPDYHPLETEKGKNSLGVELIRKVLEKIYSYPQQDKAKVIRISCAELLTEAAAHALLKTLEEPPSGTYFLLSCREPLRILSTLRSRCMHWHLKKPDEKLSMQWLSIHASRSAIEQRTALRLYNGEPIAAKEFLLSDRWQKRSAMCDALHISLIQHDMLSFLPFLNLPDVGESLRWLCTLLIDAIKWQNSLPDYLLNQDQYPLIRQIAGQSRRTSLPKIVQRWFICRHQLLSVAGVNRELLLTNELLFWEEACLSPDRFPA